MGSMDLNIQRMEAQIKAWDARIDWLTIEAETSGEHVREDCLRSARELRDQWVGAQARLRDFKAAGSETWEAFRSGMEGAWRDLDAALPELPTRAPGPKPPKPAAGLRTAPFRSNFKGTGPRPAGRYRGNSQ